ncbi:MAG: HPr family phosphocarrier protein [Deltaproteobacteria bacterium]|nr:HPr family phosphocarrier protein [Deltaproteobacteria bacterium]
MTKRISTIVNERGLHARAAAKFVKTASQFESEIVVSKDGIEADGKGIMDLLMLAAQKGSQIEIEATGPDADKALNELDQLVQNGFGE